MSSPREAIPSGTVDRRFRGASFGKGANFTPFWIGSDEKEDLDDWPSRIPVGHDGVIEESTGD